MRNLLSLLIRLSQSPWTPVAAFFGLALLETAVCGATTITANSGPIGGPANDLNNSVIIPGAASVSGCGLSTAAVAYSLDSQKQNIIQRSAGAAVGGVVGVAMGVGVPAVMVAAASKAQGALITHAPALLHHLPVLSHVLR